MRLCVTAHAQAWWKMFQSGCLGICMNYRISSFIYIYIYVCVWEGGVNTCIRNRLSDMVELLLWLFLELMGHVSECRDLGMRHQM